MILDSGVGSLNTSGGTELRLDGGLRELFQGERLGGRIKASSALTRLYFMLRKGISSLEPWLCSQG